MRRFALASLAVCGLGLGFALGAPGLFADDAAPLTQSDEERIQALVLNLGAAQFDIREHASRALAEFGPKAKPALEKALQSDSAEVRMRAYQILQKIEGRGGERRLGDAEEPKEDGRERPSVRRFRWNTSPGAPGVPGVAPGEWQKWMEDLEQRMNEMQERLRRQFGEPGKPDGNGGGFVWPGRPFGLQADAFGARTFERGEAHLAVGPRGVRLTLRSKDEPAPGAIAKTMRTYAAPSLDELLAILPDDVKTSADVAGVLDEARKARADAKSGAGGLLGGPNPTLRGDDRRVQVEVNDDGAKVTVTETGPDGKAETKTYEGKTLDDVLREHPELKDRVGGFEVRILPGGPMGAGWPWTSDGRLRRDDRFEPSGPFGPFGPRSGTPSPDAPEADDEAPVATGPFGIALRVPGGALASQLSLGDQEGALVLAVRDGSDAAKLGLRLHDVIVAVNGTRVRGFDGDASASALIRGAAKDATLRIDVLRAGTTVTLRNP